MSNQAAVSSAIEKFIRSKFDVQPSDPDFTLDTHLFDYGYIDSFGAQVLIEHIEATYGIKVADDDLIKFPLNTVNEISGFVIDRQSGVR